MTFLEDGSVVVGAAVVRPDGSIERHEVREVLVHLHVTVNPGDGRNADEIADWLLAALETAFGAEEGSFATDGGGFIECTLAEEI